MKIFRGKVVGVKNKKTAIVEVARFFTHPLYLKRIRKTKRYPVHNESDIKEGDIVNFAETGPISKTKRWRIVEVIRREKISKVPEVPEVPKVSKGKKGENQRLAAKRRQR